MNPAPKKVYVVLDGHCQPAGVYSTRRAATTNKGLWGRVVVYTLEKKETK